MDSNNTNSQPILTLVNNRVKDIISYIKIDALTKLSEYLFLVDIELDSEGPIQQFIANNGSFSVIDENEENILFFTNSPIVPNYPNLQFYRLSKVVAPEFKITLISNSSLNNLDYLEEGLSDFDSDSIQYRQDLIDNIASIFNRSKQGENSTANDEISSLKLQIDQEKNKYLELLAEFKRVRERFESEKKDLKTILVSNMASEILDVYNDIKLAMSDEALNLEVAKSILDSSSRKINNTLLENNIAIIDTNPGDVFDKDTMEALGLVDGGAENQGKVINVVSRGILNKINQKVIKSSKVIVGK